MLPPVRIESKASDFHALHVAVWANTPFAGSLRPQDPYVVMHALLIQKNL